MKKRLFAGLLASAVLAAAFAIPAEAGCVDRGTCFSTKKITKKKVSRKSATAVKSTSKKKVHKSRSTKASTRKPRKHQASSRSHHPATAQGGQVVAMIKAMAPGHGVPTWFALRIAKVESNYNPGARGRAGELGVYQLKCATAKGIGFRGNCSALLDARTNITYGLKHLALAMKSSRGNLRLAASKHNGGLGRKTEVHGYVAKIF